MTTYKLLLDSPKYDKKLQEIKRIAKRYKKEMAILGDCNIDFKALPQLYTSTSRYGDKQLLNRDSGKHTTGTGVLIQLQ